MHGLSHSEGEAESQFGMASGVMRTHVSARILVVDDERDLRLAFRRMLERENYDVEVAESGQEALDLLQKNSYDLLLTDVSMASVDGLELLATLRERNDQTPAVVISGVGTVEHALRAISILFRDP